MSYKIIVIQTVEQFNTIYNEFKESAKINFVESNEIYHIGLDTEYISKDNNPKSFSNCQMWLQKADKIAVCKLQLATNKMSLVIDLCKFNKMLPDNLVKIITAESWIKTGIGISNDLKYLSYNFDLGQCNGGIDIKQIAELKECHNPNLFDVFHNTSNNQYNDTIKKHKKKFDPNTDWSNDMTMEQIEYAGMDAYMSYKIGEYLINGIIKYPQFDKLKSKIKMDQQILISTPIAVKNYIGRLQEYTQKNKINMPIYQYQGHDLTTNKFQISCTVQNITTNGYGANKKDAKISAAKYMLKKLNIFDKTTY